MGKKDEPKADTTPATEVTPPPANTELDATSSSEQAPTPPEEVDALAAQSAPLEKAAVDAPPPPLPKCTGVEAKDFYADSPADWIRKVVACARTGCKPCQIAHEHRFASGMYRPQ